MKHTLRKCMLLLVSLVSMHSFGQSISLNQITNLSKCTGDSLNIQLNIGAPGFNFGNQYTVEFAEGNLATVDFSTAVTLPIVKWAPLSNPPNVLDSIGAGPKVATVIIPSNITLNNFYSIRMIASNPVVTSDTIQLTVNVSPESSIDTIIGGFPNPYTFTNPNDWGFCEDDTVQLKAVSGMDSYQWIKDGTPIPGEDTDSLYVYQSGVYSVEVGLGNCTDISKDTIINMVIIPTQIIPTDFSYIAGEDSVRFCEDDSVTLRGPSVTSPLVTFEYQWMVDTLDALGFPHPKTLENDTLQEVILNTSGKYRVEIYDGFCTDTSDFYWVIVDSIPDTQILEYPFPGQTPTMFDVCITDSIRLSAADSVSTWGYQWQVQYPSGTGPWLNLPNDTLPWLVVDTTIIQDTASYRLSMVNNANDTNFRLCTYITTPVQVNIIPLPTFTFAPSDSIDICEGDSVVVLINGNASDYFWDNGAYVGSSRVIYTAGTYPVEGVNQFGCSSWDTLKVVFNVVAANAGPDQTVKAGETVFLGASGGTDYYWFADKPVSFSNPQDPNASTLPNEDTTKYYVMVMDGNGCTDIDSMMVYIDRGVDENVNNISNVVTPNGDGFNDLWDLSEVMAGRTCELVILNRWGAEIYSTVDYQNNWGGTNQAGDKLPDGTYYYILRTGGQDIATGGITILSSNQ